MPFTPEEAYEIGEAIGIDWDAVEFDSEQLAVGMEVELEHLPPTNKKVRPPTGDQSSW